MVNSKVSNQSILALAQSIEFAEIRQIGHLHVIYPNFGLQ